MSGCIYCSHSKDWIGNHRYCINPKCSMFLSGLNFNSRTIDLERFLVDEPGQTKCNNHEVLEQVKNILEGRRNGKYIQKACGWLENKEA